MASMFWCKHCKDYYPRERYYDHMNQHKSELNIDAIEHKQYIGTRVKSENDYMICVTHQKKYPCPVKDCRYTFGIMRKSYMLRCAKGYIGTDEEVKLWKEGVRPNENSVYLNYPRPIIEPFFPFIEPSTGERILIPIDMKTKTVILMGATIHLRI